LATHALPPERLAETTRRVLQRKVSRDRPLPLQISALIAGDPKNREAAWACATRHVEHKGKKRKPSWNEPRKNIRQPVPGSSPTTGRRSSRGTSRNSFASAA